MSLLEVKNLSVEFGTGDSKGLAVRNNSFSLEKGKTLGIVGESGCGKSVSAFSILQLISAPGKITSGEIFYKGEDLLKKTEDQMRAIRGKDIAMIFQEPMTSLNPVFTIGYQLIEGIMLHLNMNKKEAQRYAIEMLNKVGIPSPQKRIHSYPHEFSGGMRQRVMIAMALSASPDILIADEPTTALDVTIQAQILDLLLELQEQEDMSMIMITHDLGIVANVADDVAIMYAGEVIEEATVRDVFENAQHPYTKGLFAAIPHIGETKENLSTISGTVPSLNKEPEGCVFYPRCYNKADECIVQSIPLLGKGHKVRCVRVSD